MAQMLVGRQRELDEVSEGLSARQLVVVRGEAGIGKTALLRTAAARTGRPVFLGGGLALLAKWAFELVTLD